ncbi:hypothetical protein N0V83_007905 [Neocucurbitaria cava]|uniref:Uncharacterized protein n=1 Tax=Neocucurbitaria cava TaxID=798079 RepID=A0A9W9CJ23_9PLEO|nr:hypothetical protein N0V83_007905 [Neocucurbitaria cava]
MTTKSKSLIVTLKLSPQRLSTFPHDPVAAPAQESKPNSTPSDTPAPQIVEPTPADTPADSTAAMNGTSTPSSLAPPGPKRKGPKPGSKRSAAVMEGTNGSEPKQRGKPGPKRKKNLGDMINDPNNKGPFPNSAPAQKLGPKANMGAINQNLRALDRTGKFKCRKWEKKGFNVRSFTGVLWHVPSWKAPSRSAGFSEDVKSDSTGSSDSKLKDESSAISEKSGLNGDGSTPVPTPLNGIASSPTPIPAT